ncbi:protein-L-isoaspartate O-methyltransferase, partial [Coprinopsis sp. MPI-PUGE-AT-0042]
RVLGVEVGSGYLVSVLHHLVSPSGKVVRIDLIPALSVENLRKDGLSEVLEKKGIEVIAGDGREGYYQGGPYDAIHVGARAP